MSEVRIRIGVSLDANPGAILSPIESAVKRVRKTVASEMGAAGKAMADETAKGAKAAAKEAEKLAKAQAKAAQQGQRAQERAAKETAKAQTDASREAQREAERSARAQIREAERTARQRVTLERAAAREIAAAKRVEEKRQANSIWNRGGGLWGASGGAIGIGRRAGIRTSRGFAAAYGYGGQALSSATSIGLDVANGLGYDTSLTSHIRAAKEQQSLATKISNAGNVPGTQLVDPEDILAKARAVGNATGTDATEALDALRAFVGKTGDLKTGMDSLGQMATLSKATGTNLEDMTNAAAEVTNQLGDMPNKGQAVYAIMKQIAGQGKLGAVEIRDLAVQMAKIGAASSRFTGGAVANIATLGVLAQEAKLRGGASSASQAAQSVVAFAGGFSTKATFKNWTKFMAPVPGKPGKFEGLNPFTDNSHTQLSDPMTIIKAALSATRGDQTKLSTLFPSKQGFRAVAGFANVYSEAARGVTGDAEAKNAAGIAAVTAEFERLKAAQLDEQEVTRAFTAQMSRADAKSAKFNNKMTEMAEKLETALLPAVDGAGEALVTFAGMATDALNLLTGHDPAKDKADKTSGDAFGALAGANSDALDRSAGAYTVDPKTKKRVYNQNAVDVDTKENKDREGLIAKLGAQVKDEQGKASLIDMQLADRSSPLGAKAARDPEFAKKTSDEAHDRANKDAQVLSILERQHDKTSGILAEIARGIAEGNAIARSKPSGGTNVDTDGRAPAAAETSE